MKRDRATGWQHAKLSGHKNEDAVKRLFDNPTFCKSFASRLGVSSIASASVGGLHEEDVECILGGKTKSKTDLILTLQDGSTINISIKKSSAGQVYLISVDRFIEGYEKQYGIPIPNEVKDLLHLYFHGHTEVLSLLNTPDIVHDESAKLVAYQKRKGRLVWKSLENFDAEKADIFKAWFKENIANITDFCFSRGLAKNSKDWADYVWYINKVGEYTFDFIFKINDIKDKVAQNTDDVCQSKINGGSTLWLPFGFVQWHQGQMQFHHKLKKLQKLFEEDE